MKTALQEFIDNVIPMHIIELDMIKQEIKKALEKEKEQIINSHTEGYSNYDSEMTSIEYYNQTYNN
jgi:hypothetical protein